MKVNGFIKHWSVLVYTASTVFAIAAGAFVAAPAARADEARDLAAIIEMREGDMRKLNFHSDPKPVSSKSFISEDGEDMTLEAFRGKIVLLNFWATWCAPCRHEMPMLSELQTQLGGDSFEVVTIATGRNMVPAMRKFFEDISVDNLPLHRDPKQLLAREMAVFGLPATLIVDANGKEIARLQGDADWSSENARAILSALIEIETP
ncbi:Thiol:disulfide interchange protein TlpA [Shimia sp. SK013]|uniref:TlpA family protein disulfide reductase n=1 Tax=Shimia sp. SK013 TaxID=1389006 RepID=UPI0006CD0296|nr:TlpA disulfide reductase family protein [Shimia sp. SK013]KPA21582.1 Thiol:disulfide interchange protein TlpA [Shimia sp. SK013]